MQINQVLIPFLLSFLAGISTAIGGFIAVYKKKIDKKYLAFFLGFSAGVMIYISFMELLPEAVADIGFLRANILFFVGIFFIMIIDRFFPHSCIYKGQNLSINRKELLSAGVFTALGIAIHNFPEGIAVFTSAFESVKLGIPLFIAIAIHNIPEGMVISLPIYYATKRRKKAVLLALLSGLSEPLGAVIGFTLFSQFMGHAFLSVMLSLVAGIMVYISFDELLPVCMKNSEGHISIAGIISGMIVIFFSLYWF